MDLISTLKVQHQELVELCVEIDAAAQAGDAVQLTAALQRLSDVAQAHLRLEDRELYPGLVRMAKVRGKVALAETARSFSSGMTEISSALIAFLERFARSDVDLAAFTEQWPAIKATLSKRIHSEEDMLYPLFKTSLEAMRAAAP